MLTGRVPVGAERAQVGITTTGTLIVVVMGLLEAVTETTQTGVSPASFSLLHTVSALAFACGCTCRRCLCTRGKFLYKHAGLSFLMVVSGIVVILLSLTALWPSQ